MARLKTRSANHPCQLLRSCFVLAFSVGVTMRPFLSRTLRLVCAMSFRA